MNAEIPTLPVGLLDAVTKALEENPEEFLADLAAAEHLDRNPASKELIAEALAEEPDDLDDMQKYAPLIPIFGAVEELFAAWEKMVRDLEIETEPAVWTKKLNRTQRRLVIYRHGDDKPQRSRTRRRINRIERKKGNYQ